MESIPLTRTARMIVEEALRVQPGENVCIVTDTNKLRIAEVLAAAAHAAGAETVVACMTPRQAHGNEVPPVIAGAMLEANVIIAPTTYAITHTRGRIAASRKGARTIILRGITEETFTQGAMTADYRQVRRLTDRLVEILTAASRVRVTSPEGTDIQFDVTGRPALGLSGYALEKGTFSSLPSGEAAIVPLEGSAEGVIVVDHAMDNIGIVDEPMRLTVVKGRVVSVEGGRSAAKLRELMAAYDENANNLAEFAIGTNPCSRMLGNIAEDKICLGTVHFAVGDSHTIGGTVHSGLHLDGIVLNPTVEVDGKVIVQNRKVLLDEAREMDENPR